MISIKKILCPIDFSKPSYVALEAANGLALQYSSELYLVNVVQPIISDVMIGKFNYQLYEKRLISAAKKSLKEVIEQRVSKELRVHSTVVSGYPSDDIVKIAAQKNRHYCNCYSWPYRLETFSLWFGRREGNSTRSMPCAGYTSSA